MRTDELAELFLRVGARMRAMEAERFAPFGVTPAQARVLGVIARGQAPPRMAELARRLGVVPRAVTPLVDALEKANLVRRRSDPDNRRAVLLDLTDHGVAVRRELREQRLRAAEDLFAPLTDGQRATLVELLEAVTSGGPATERSGR
ncbi:MarR family winged helix-turn-helix transcriptional regulator [Pseudonocardia acaciae]|uniref:MarR family winged helix-turn-helix transcriptional regulator n=1 Tax=Pseudonocardia acaciae TaxID=551276 RepID=UPI0004919BBE|nr:MarR family transcriptional regulator [Pseudonocardia acaciae]